MYETKLTNSIQNITTNHKPPNIDKHQGLKNKIKLQECCSTIRAKLEMNKLEHT